MNHYIYSGSFGRRARCGEWAAPADSDLPAETGHVASFEMLDLHFSPINDYSISMNYQISIRRLTKRQGYRLRDAFGSKTRKTMLEQQEYRCAICRRQPSNYRLTLFFPIDSHNLSVLTQTPDVLAAGASKMA